jgi:hypothetical protein
MSYENLKDILRHPIIWIFTIYCMIRSSRLSIIEIEDKINPITIDATNLLRKNNLNIPFIISIQSNCDSFWRTAAYYYVGSVLDGTMKIIIIKPTFRDDFCWLESLILHEYGHGIFEEVWMDCNCVPKFLELMNLKLTEDLGDDEKERYKEQFCDIFAMYILNNDNCNSVTKIRLFEIISIIENRFRTGRLRQLRLSGCDS